MRFKLLKLILFLIFSCGVFHHDDNSTESSCAESVDCAGVCGGSSVIDACGECGGDDSGCPDEPTNSVHINYSSETPIAGFQFKVDSPVTVINASGGAADEANFSVSTGNNTVLGFSFSGSTIPTGEGILVVLEITGSGAVCVLPVELIFSDTVGEALHADVEDCTIIHVSD